MGRVARKVSIIGAVVFVGAFAAMALATDAPTHLWLGGACVWLGGLCMGLIIGRGK